MDLLDKEKIGNDFTPYNNPTSFIEGKYKSHRNKWSNNRETVSNKLLNGKEFEKIKNGLVRAKSAGLYRRHLGKIKDLVPNYVVKQYILDTMEENNPVDRLEDIVNTYRQPDMYLKKSGGKAIWIHKTLLIRKFKHVHEIIVEDIFTSHLHPLPHLDFLTFKIYTNIDEDILKNKYAEAMKITGSLRVSYISGIVSGTCDNEHACNVTNYLAILFILDKITLREAKYFYAVLIMDEEEYKTPIINKLNHFNKNGSTDDIHVLLFINNQINAGKVKDVETIYNKIGNDFVPHSGSMKDMDILDKEK